MSIEKRDEYLLRLLEGEDNLKIKLKNEIDSLLGEKNIEKPVSGKIVLKELLTHIEREKRKINNKNPVKRD